MERNTDQRGFGLIELLLVIAIFGILAGLILTSTDRSRRKSEDVRIRSGVRQLRVLAETYFNANNNTYTGFEACVESPSLANCQDQQTSDNVTILRTDIEDAYGQPNIIDAADGTNEFCVTAPLRLQASLYVCADEGGEVEENTSATSPCDAQAVCTFD